MTRTSGSPRGLSDAQVRQLIRDGFVRIDGAFPREVAEEGRTSLRTFPVRFSSSDDPGDAG